MINIIGGKFKKKKIDVPKKYVRPTSALKREAIFSIIESYALKNIYEPYKKKCFIDLFAGSGSLGLEAISRGAEHSYFFDNEQEVCKILEKNCNQFNEINKFSIIKRDINLINTLKINYPLSAIFIDPPYESNPFDSIFQIIIKSQILSKESLIIAEMNKKNSLNFLPKLKIINEKIYGKTKIVFLSKI